MADGQSLGIAGVFAVAAAAVGAYGKSVWQVLSGAVKMRRESADGKARRNVSLIEVTDRVATGLLDRLERENGALTDDNIKLRAQVNTLTDTVHRQGVTIAQLTERLDRLEAHG